MAVEILKVTRATTALPRQGDAAGLLIHCCGGIRFSKIRDDEWSLEPISDNGLPSRVGPFSRSEMYALQREAGIVPIAFEDIEWIDGCWHSSWRPIAPSRSNHFLSPASYWSNISHSVGRSRVRSRFEKAKSENVASTSIQAAAEIFDDRDRTEALALSISHSLRSMDIHVARITDFYHEQLVDNLSLGTSPDQRRGSSQDSVLYAHVQSFFDSFGSARDYLGALLGYRIGIDKKGNSLAWLLREAKDERIETDAIGKRLLDSGLLVACETGGRLRQNDWLAHATGLRKTLLHHVPYGMRLAEHFGHINPVTQQYGLYRYERPIVQPNGIQADALTVISDLYLKSAGLFIDLAVNSGHDTSNSTITDDDIMQADLREST